MSNHYHEQKKRISAATKNVILLFIFSVALTGAAVHFMKDGIPELKNKIEMLKSEKNTTWNNNSFKPGNDRILRRYSLQQCKRKY